MAMATIAGKEVHVNEEGFLTEYDEWSEDIGAELAKNIEVEMTDEHWSADPVAARGLQGQGRDRHDPPRADRGWSAHQEAVRALPQEARQEDVLRRRAAQAQGLRLNPRATPHQ